MNACLGIKPVISRRVCLNNYALDPVIHFALWVPAPSLVKLLSKSSSEALKYRNDVFGIDENSSEHSNVYH